MYSLKTAANARANLLVKNISLRRDILLLIETINSKINTESTVSYYIPKEFNKHITTYVNIFKDAGYDVEWFSTSDDSVYRLQISW